MFNVRAIWFLGFLSLSYLVYLSVTTGAWGIFLLSFVYYKIVSLFGNQIAMHRYFSHKSFKTSKTKHTLLCFLSILIGQDSPVMYASGHRHHHVYSDKDKDLHSPLNQSFFQLCFWSWQRKEWFIEHKKVRLAVDLLKDPLVAFIHNHYILIWALIIAVVGAISWKFLVLFVLPCVAFNAIHMTLFRVYFVHVKLPGSYRNFETQDYSWNNKFLQILDIGEGLHNNHHMYPNKYDQAVVKGEFDPAGWIVKKFLEKKNNE